MRDQQWLNAALGSLLGGPFADMPQTSPIAIGYGRAAKNRMGSIRLHKGVSSILINPLLTSPEVPEVVVLSVIAHELAHYAHGYGSHTPRKYPYPHRGGVVEKELQRRGMLAQSRLADTWLNMHWQKHYETCRPAAAAKAKTVSALDAYWANRQGRSMARDEQFLQSLSDRLAQRCGLAPLSAVWLYAGSRHKYSSYRKHLPDAPIEVHPLLAHTSVPGAVLEFEVCYWFARRHVGKSSRLIYVCLAGWGLEAEYQAAMQWRSRCWNALLARQRRAGR